MGNFILDMVTSRIKDFLYFCIRKSNTFEKETEVNQCRTILR